MSEQEPVTRRNGTLRSAGQVSGYQKSSYHKPKTVDEVTARNVEAIAQMDHAAKANRTRTDRVIDGITKFCGSLAFVWVHAAWFGGWMVFNLLGKHRPDPYPFQLLTLIVSLEAIFLSAFILISQNHQSKLAERRNHLDLQINLLSEQENTKMLTMLKSIVTHLNIPDSDPDVSVLEEATEPERLVQQIEKVIEAGG